MRKDVHLLLRSIVPENQEFPMVSLSSRINPNELFFRRNHFPYPEVNFKKWALAIQGCVKKSFHLNYYALNKFPKVTLPATLECAGNKRALYHPKARGEQWELGAISHAEWTGIPLRKILKLSDIQPDAVEILFEGMDFGHRADVPGTYFYARSLPLHKALHPETILALYMNGEPLPFKHGFPLRLIVPGWYGMASVKWLKRIVVLNGPFQGPFQKLDYILLREPGDYENAIPLTNMQVNSSIAHPADQSILRRGKHIIYGVAWSGISSVTDIKVSTDGGSHWESAKWVDPKVAYSWRRWEYCWDAVNSGTYTLLVKAADEKGHEQPDQALWNVKGYANNSVHKVTVYVG